jgi:hypothetical protein
MCEEKYLVYQIIIKFNSENENVKFQKQKDWKLNKKSLTI